MERALKSETQPGRQAAGDISSVDGVEGRLPFVRARDALEGYTTKSEVVYRHLRDAIVEGVVRPGQRLVVDQLALDLGVSKVPIREAILRLSGEGWVQLKPHVGPVVPALSLAEIEETAVIRAALESTALRYSVPRRNTESLARLNALLDQMDAATDDLAQDFALLNRSYHTLAIAACPFPRLKRMAREMTERTIRYRTAWRVPAYTASAQREHRTILKAISRGDADRAAELTALHVLNAAETLRRRLEEGVASE